MNESSDLIYRMMVLTSAPCLGAHEALLATHRGLLERLLCGPMLTYICRESFPNDRLRNGLLPKALPLVGAVV